MSVVSPNLNSSDTKSCYHCGLAVPSNTHFTVNIQGQLQHMCCVGCQAVAMAIVDGGLENFYQYRTTANARAENSDVDWSIYDLPEVQSEFVTLFDSEFNQAHILLEGISCAACSWLIETHLKKYPAVKIVNVNVSTHRCSIVWNANELMLSEIFRSLASIGYKPRPATDEQQQEFFKKENRLALFRLGVAGFGMMQAMMVAVGIYFGATDTWLDFFTLAKYVGCNTGCIFFVITFF